METASIGLLAAALDTSISMDQKVPALTIICIVLSLIMCVGAPIGFFLVIRKRIRVVGQAVIFGVLGYMVASTILVQLTFGLILMMPGATDLLNNNPAIQRILGVALTALYEVLGFFLGLIGLVYVAGKPVAPKKVAQQQKHLAEAVVDALQ